MTANPIEERLVEARGRFLAFVRARVSDRELAEDILQDAFIRALGSFDQVRDQDLLVPWFYQILRNGIIDAYRRKSVRDRHSASFPDGVEHAEPLTAVNEAELCECFRELLPSLKPEYAVMIESELSGELTLDLAKRLGITPNNLKVRRHRARQALRSRLEATCRICSHHGCLDCTCDVGVRRPSTVRDQV